jgi:hypothetical protein
MKYAGKVFIVPNMARLTVPEYEEVCGHFYESLPDTDKTKSSIAVQVWIYNDDCDNWRDHGYNVGTSFLPYEWLKDRKEGDTINVQMIGRDGNIHAVSLTLQQAKSRYSWTGPFEEALKGVTKSEIPNYSCSMEHTLPMEELAKRWNELLGK